MSATEETVIRRKRARMCTFQYQMPRIRDQVHLALRISPPQQEYDRILSFIQKPNDLIRQLFPTAMCMRIRLTLPYGQNRVQHQYSLLCPCAKITVGRNAAAEIIMQFRKNILQGRRRSNALLYRKAQTVRLVSSMIWILSQYNDLHILVCRIFQRVKNVIHIRKDLLCRIFD